MVTITETLLKQGKSRNGGWSIKQLRELGVSTGKRGQLPKKWKRKLICKSVYNEQAERFISLKDKHLKSIKKSFSEEDLLNKQHMQEIGLAVRQPEKQEGSSGKSWSPALIADKARQKALRRRKASIKLMKAYKGLYDCKECIHGLISSCLDRLPNGCEYFSDEVTGRRFAIK